MSREIKYRFWNKKIGAMIDWDLMKKECDRLSIFTHPDFIPLEFCGLVDKNGKEIFEGDIVICRFAFGDNVCEVVYDNGKAGFFVSQDNRAIQDKAYDNLHWHLEGIEVIGNIYENPELLKGSP